MAKSLSLPVSLALLWLIGVGLRLVLLAVPPVIPVLRDEFHLSGTEIGVLTGLPLVVFGLAALAGSRLVARIGVIAAAVCGLFLGALGSASRAAATDFISLLGATMVMGVGIAVVHPAMPALVGRWLPHRIVLGTGVYTNGLLVGEIVPVAVFPLLFTAVGESWRATFVIWAVPTVAIALLLLAVAPREKGAGADVSSRWWPDWPARDVLRLGLIFGGVGPLYFGSNAFLPGYLSEIGEPNLISPALTALNLGQFPASLLLIAFAPRVEGRAWPLILSGLLGIAGVVGIVATSGAMIVVSAAVIGFAAGATFALGLSLPPLLSAPGEVARVSAAMFTISYATTVVIAVLCGVAWDLTGTARFAFLPVALAVLPTLLLVPTIRFGSKPGDRDR